MPTVIKLICEEEVRRASLAQDDVTFENVLELIHDTWPELPNTSLKFVNDERELRTLSYSSFPEFWGTQASGADRAVLKLWLSSGPMETRADQQRDQQGAEQKTGQDDGKCVSSHSKGKLEPEPRAAVQWIDKFVPKAWKERRRYYNSEFACFPEPVWAIEIHLPLDITQPFFDTQVSYTDCAECCLLRFIQLALLDWSQETEKSGPHLSINTDRTEALGADGDVVNYFRDFPDALPQRCTPLEARCAWAALVTRRAGCAYVRRGGFEMNAGVENFLATLKALFPRLPLCPEVTKRSDDGSALHTALEVVGNFFSVGAKKLSIANFECVGPLWSYNKGPGDLLCRHPITGGYAPNSIAIDRETSFDLCVNDSPIYHFDFWDRHFPAEGDPLCDGHDEITSGHAQMSHANPGVPWACTACTYENEPHRIECAMCYGRPGVQ